MNVSVVDEQALTAALAEVRDDSSEVTWAMANHDGKPDSIKLACTGTGDVDEFISKLEEDNISYVLYRVTEKVELANTVKFVYLHFVGGKVPMVKKGRFGIARGSVTDKFFSPHHVAFENVSDFSDIDEKTVKRKVAEASGTAIHELESIEGRQVRGFTSKPSAQDSPHIAAATTTAKTPQYKNVKPVETKSAVISFTDDLKEAIKCVRDDTNPMAWVIAGYSGGDPKSNVVEKASTGEGDVEEFVGTFDDSMAQYGIFRGGDKYEGIETVKFVYVAWAGESMGIMARARLSVHKGACSEFFAPHHVTFEATNKNDIDPETVSNKISMASGSKNNVL